MYTGKHTLERIRPSECTADAMFSFCFPSVLRITDYRRVVPLPPSGCRLIGETIITTPCEPRDVVARYIEIQGVLRLLISLFCKNQYCCYYFFSYILVKKAILFGLLHFPYNFYLLVFIAVSISTHRWTVSPNCLSLMRYAYFN
ncbi:hypothetical protein QTP88_005334 [Uroleucon formosanum]